MATNGVSSKMEARMKPLARKDSRLQPVLTWWLALCRSAPDGIGIAGLKYILMSRESKIRRIAWLCVLLGATSVLILQITERGIFFSKTPMAVDMSVTLNTEELTFPKVIICNYNIYVKSKVEAIPAVHKLLRNYENLKYNRTENDVPLTPEDLADIQAMDMRDVALAMGHEKEFMFLRTYFAGKPISYDDITQVFTEKGICYQLNDGQDGRALLKSSNIGRSSGLSLVLNTEEEKYYYNRYLIDSVGFLIQLLDQNETSSVLELGFSVAPGTKTSIAIKASRHLKEKPPYGMCGEKKLRYFHKYSRTKCLKECISDFIVSKCGCRRPANPGTAKVCDPITMALCTQPISESNAIDYEQCRCPEECEARTFSTSISAARYPSTFRAHRIEEYMNEGSMQLPGIENVNSSFIQKNFVGVDLFFSDLRTTLVTQRASYPLFAFLSDIGGALGLWLGGSVLTLYEIIDICSHAFFSTRRR